MLIKVAAVVLGVALLLVAILYVDRAVLRLTLTPLPQDANANLVRVRIQNEGPWDATTFSFGCSAIRATDARGSVIFDRGSPASFLAAVGGDLPAGESREQACSLTDPPAAAGARKVEFAGMATFGVRYLPMLRTRRFRVLVERDDRGQLQAIGATSQ